MVFLTSQLKFLLLTSGSLYGISPRRHSPVHSTLSLGPTQLLVAIPAAAIVSLFNGFQVAPPSCETSTAPLPPVIIPSEPSGENAALRSQVYTRLDTPSSIVQLPPLPSWATVPTRPAATAGCPAGAAIANSEVLPPRLACQVAPPSLVSST